MNSEVDVMIELGGNITLSHFQEVSSADMVIIKKIVGNFVKSVSAKCDFKALGLTLKEIHKSEGKGLFEIKAKLEAEKLYHAEVTDRNLFFAVDKVLKKVEAEIR